MDPIADMLVQIKNAGEAKKQMVVIPYSNFKFTIAQTLLREGYVAGVSRKGKGTKRTIEVLVAYEAGASRIKGIKRISKVSRRMYTGMRNIKLVRQGHGDIVLSTPKGVLTGKEARKAKVGGEALFSIW